MEEKKPKIVENNGKNTFFHPSIGHALGRRRVNKKKITFKIENDCLIIDDDKKEKCFAMTEEHRYFMDGVTVTENPLGYRIRMPKDGSISLSFPDPIEEITSVTFKGDKFDIEELAKDGADVCDVLLFIEDCINERNDVYLTKDEAIAALKEMAPIIYFKRLPVDHGRIDISSYAQYGFKCQAVGMTYNGHYTECLLQFYLPEVK